MKIKIVFIFLITVFGSYNLVAQPLKIKKPVYLIVHGAWGGSWAFKKVDSLLTEKGAIVYRPSLTGLGERVHLASKDIGLKTHIDDVVNTILYEELRDIILVGHSYGGMVITGVADRVPDRIKRIIYIDAFVPQNGESVKMLRGDRWSLFANMEKNGFLYPSWMKEGKIPGDVPHPLKTWTDTIVLKNEARNKIPSVYILTIEKGKKPEEDDFYSQALRAKNMNWQMFPFEADHNPQWSAVDKLVEMLDAQK